MPRVHGRYFVGPTSTTTGNVIGKPGNPRSAPGIVGGDTAISLPGDPLPLNRAAGDEWIYLADVAGNQAGGLFFGGHDLDGFGRPYNFSLECWFRPPSGTFTADLLNQQHTAFDPGRFLQWRVSSNGTVSVFADNPLVAPFPIDGHAHHVVVTYDVEWTASGSGQIPGVQAIAPPAPTIGAITRIYVDGVEQASRSGLIAGGASYYANRIGPLAGGVIDEFAVYYYPLSAERVLAHYAARNSNILAYSQAVINDVPWLYYHLNEPVLSPSLQFQEPSQSLDLGVTALIAFRDSHYGIVFSQDSTTLLYSLMLYHVETDLSVSVFGSVAIPTGWSSGSFAVLTDTTMIMTVWRDTTGGGGSTQAEVGMCVLTRIGNGISLSGVQQIQTAAWSSGVATSYRANTTFVCRIDTTHFVRTRMQANAPQLPSPVYDFCTVTSGTVSVASSSRQNASRMDVGYCDGNGHLLVRDIGIGNFSTGIGIVALDFTIGGGIVGGDFVTGTVLGTEDDFRGVIRGTMDCVLYIASFTPGYYHASYNPATHTWTNAQPYSSPYFETGIFTTGSGIRSDFPKYVFGDELQLSTATQSGTAVTVLSGYHQFWASRVEAFAPYGDGGTPRNLGGGGAGGACHGDLIVSIYTNFTYYPVGAYTGPEKLRFAVGKVP